MTREEAKTRLISMKAKFEMLLSMRGLEISDVFDVAIEALSAEHCEDCISRQAAIKAMNDLEQEDIERYGCPIPEGFDGKRAIETLQSLPSVTPKQKMGRWIWQTEDIYRCSECGEDIHVKEVMKVPQYEFCPMCGAKMAESEDKE